MTEKNEESNSDQWGNKSGQTHMSSASLTGRKEMKDRKVPGEITAENTKSLIKNNDNIINSQIQGSQWIPSENKTNKPKA